MRMILSITSLHELLAESLSLILDYSLLVHQEMIYARRDDGRRSGGEWILVRILKGLSLSFDTIRWLIKHARLIHENYYVIDFFESGHKPSLREISNQQ